jgi:hypothetical protein
MDNWLIFQLAVDAALLAVVVLLALRDGKPQAEMGNDLHPAPERASVAGPNLLEIEVLIEELGKLVVRAEKAADRIEKGIASTGDVVAVGGAIKASVKPDTRGVPPGSGAVLDDDTYLKAARLIKKGLPDDDIGRKVGLPPHEVSLIRKMMI